MANKGRRPSAPPWTEVPKHDLFPVAADAEHPDEDVTEHPENERIDVIVTGADPGQGKTTTFCPAPPCSEGKKQERCFYQQEQSQFPCQANSADGFYHPDQERNG